MQSLLHAQYVLEPLDGVRMDWMDGVVFLKEMVTERRPSQWSGLESTVLEERAIVFDQWLGLC